MGRKFVDCRDDPQSKCTLALSSDNEGELIEAVVQHAKAMHGCEDTPEFRRQIKDWMKEGSPPA